MTARGCALLALTAALVACSAPHAEATGSRFHGDKFDVDEAVAALSSDPIYIAPGATARIDEQRVRAALTGTSNYVVLGPPVPDYEFFDSALEHRLPNRDGIIFADLHTYSSLSAGSEQVQIHHVRQTLESSDVTSVVLDLIRLDQSRRPDTRVWTPRIAPADPAEVTRLVKVMRASKFYVDPAVTLTLPRNQYAEDARLAHLAYRVAVLAPLAPRAAEPRLLPELAAAFPREVVILVSGRWFEAAGPDPPELLRSAVEHAVGENLHNLLTQGADVITQAAIADTAYDALIRVDETRQAGKPRPALGGSGADRRRTRSVAPWAFAVAALALALGTVSGGVWAAVRARRRAARDVRVARARIFARSLRLAADVGTLDAADDPGAHRRLAEAAERQQTASALLEHANSPKELAVVGATLDEGLSMVADARQRLAAAATAHRVPLRAPARGWRRWWQRR